MDGISACSASDVATFHLFITNYNFFLQIGLALFHGTACVLPAAIMFDQLPCGDCGTELCFGESVLCSANKISVFGNRRRGERVKRGHKRSMHYGISNMWQ